MRISLASLALSLEFGLVCGAIAPAVHAEDSAVPASTAEASKPDNSKKVCRTIVKSGTRFSTRICRSKEDWEKDRENAARYLEEGQTYGYARDGVNTAPNGSGVTPPR